MPSCYLVILVGIAILILGMSNYPITEPFVSCFYKHRSSVVSREIDERQCRRATQNYCSDIFPDTYFIKDPADMYQLKQKYTTNDWFILKKIWGTFRNGLKLARYTDNLNDPEYDQIQPLILDTYLINNRVFHIRLYLVIDCYHGNFLYRNGAFKYCSELFDRSNINQNNVITGITNNKFTYDCHKLSFMKRHNLPKTLFEFYNYLRINKQDPGQLEIRLGNLFTKYVKMKQFCRELDQAQCPLSRNYMITDPVKKTYKHKHIYGADVIIKSNLRPILIEVNQKPGLVVGNDPEMKWTDVINKHVLTLVQTSNYDATNFIKVGSN